MQLDTLLIFLFSASILTLSPGPDIIYVFLKSSTDGKIAGIKAVLGLTTGLFFHTILLVFGISALINSNEYFFMLIKFFGFVYFIFLAISTYNENSKINENKKTNRSDFVTGLMMNVLNPKVSIFFIAFFPNYIFHNSWSYELQFSILSLGLEKHSELASCHKDPADDSGNEAGDLLQAKRRESWCESVARA